MDDPQLRLQQAMPLVISEPASESAEPEPAQKVTHSAQPAVQPSPIQVIDHQAPRQPAIRPVTTDNHDYINSIVRSLTSVRSAVTAPRQPLTFVRTFR